MQFLKDTYEQNKSAVLEEYNQDFTEFQEKRQKSLEELECVKYQLEDESEKRTVEREERHLQQLDDLKSEVRKKVLISRIKFSSGIHEVYKKNLLGKRTFQSLLHQIDL